jgi:hypothetical protein
VLAPQGVEVRVLSTAPSFQKQYLLIVFSAVPNLARAFAHA